MRPNTPTGGAPDPAVEGLSDEELAEIDRHATDADVDIWSRSSSA